MFDFLFFAVGTVVGGFTALCCTYWYSQHQDQQSKYAACNDCENEWFGLRTNVCCPSCGSRDIYCEDANDKEAV